MGREVLGAAAWYGTTTQSTVGGHGMLYGYSLFFSPS